MSTFSWNFWLFLFMAETTTAKLPKMLARIKDPRTVRMLATPVYKSPLGCSSFPFRTKIEEYNVCMYLEIEGKL